MFYNALEGIFIEKILHTYKKFIYLNGLYSELKCQLYYVYKYIKYISLNIVKHYCFKTKSYILWQDPSFKLLIRCHVN